MEDLGKIIHEWEDSRFKGDKYRLVIDRISGELTVQQKLKDDTEWYYTDSVDPDSPLTDLILNLLGIKQNV